MRALILSFLGLAGCTTVFGLEAPITATRDGATDDGPARDADVTDGRDAPVPLDAPSIDAPPDALACPGEFVAIGALPSKYFIASTSRTWASAEADCEARGTHLAVLGSNTERITVDAAVDAVSWLGMTDLVTTGTFIWLTNEDTGGYPPPTGNPPWAFETSQSSGHCVALGVAGTWGNIDCGLSREYLCECDGYAADPARY